MPKFDGAPRVDHGAGPLFGGKIAGSAKARKISAGNARAFACIRKANEFLGADLFPRVEGDQLHMILDSQRLNPGDMLVALCGHLEAGVKNLRISTLTLSAERNLIQLCDLTDSKKVGSLSLLVSEMFQAKQPEMWNK